jgi:hypothetical protein
MQSVQWSEAELMPRSYRVAARLRKRGTLLKPEHPELFRSGDIVRVFADDEPRWFQRERDLQETIRVLALEEKGLRVKRAIGSRKAERIKKGDMLYIIANAAK